MLLKGKKEITRGKVKKNKHAQFGFSVNRSHFTSESEGFSTAKYLAHACRRQGSLKRGYGSLG